MQADGDTEHAVSEGEGARGGKLAQAGETEKGPHAALGGAARPRRHDTTRFQMPPWQLWVSHLRVHAEHLEILLKQQIRRQQQIWGGA